MEISLNVPTYKRAGGADTYKLLPNACFWVHEFEVEDYKKAYPSMKIGVLPDDLRGNIAKVRNYILDQTKDADVSVQLDDDIFSINIWQNCQAKSLDEFEILRLIEKNTVLASDWGAKLWGVQVNQDKQSYREYSPFSTLSYVSASFSAFLKGNDLRYDVNFPLKEDYDMLLQQLNKNRLVIRFNGIFYSKRSVSNTGGCAVYRNFDKEVEQLTNLQKKWGNKIVKFDSLDNSKSHSSKKVKKIDINPIIIAPIKGI